MKRFTQFVEAKERTAVFTFGRFNPPTIGHQKLLQKVHQVARKKGGDAHIFGSFSQNALSSASLAWGRVSGWHRSNINKIQWHCCNFNICFVFFYHFILQSIALIFVILHDIK